MELKMEGFSLPAENDKSQLGNVQDLLQASCTQAVKLVQSYLLLASVPRGAQKKEENWDFTFTAYLWPIVSLLLSVREKKKSIKIWRWEINKCNYIPGYQQQTPDKVPTLFWCWGLADSVKKQEIRKPLTDKTQALPSCCYLVFGNKGCKLWLGGKIFGSEQVWNVPKARVKVGMLECEWWLHPGQ